MAKPTPYVGVSGVVSPEQQLWIREEAEPIVAKGRQLLLGVKAVHKTHWLEVENKYGRDHYPVGSDITRSLGELSDDEMGVAQVFLDRKAAKNEGIKEYEKKFIEKLIARKAAWLTGIQFDKLPWHETDYTDLFAFIKSDQPRTVLLQCHGDIMDQYKDDISGLTELLKGYYGLVDYILFDASHGQGRELNPDALKPFIEAASNLEGIGVGVAGGLDQRAVLSRLPALLREYPELSFDAEGRLRHDAQGVLDERWTRNYLQVAGHVIPGLKNVA